jgi:hypothetical protein
MGKLQLKQDMKGAEQQAGSSKLALAPLINKPAKGPSAAAGKQQMLNGPAGKGSTLTALRQQLEAQVQEVSSRIDQDAAKLEKQVWNTTTQLDKMAQSHSAQANKVWLGWMQC